LGELLPLLIDHVLLACDIRDDVKNYTFKINTWESFQTTHRETLDMRRTPVRRDGVPKVWYMCLGNPDYNIPLHQEKAIKQKKFAYQEFDSSPKDKLFALELRAKAKEILLSNATARLEFSYRTYEGQQGKEKIARYTDDSPIPSGMRRHEPATGNKRNPRDTGRCYSPSSL
jgi:hypothetical protein